MVFVEILKTICAFFDWLIYSLATYTYVLFGAMCEMNTEKLGEVFMGLVDRIQVVFGVAMLFIIAFNLLQWLVDPGKMETSASKLVTKVAVSIVLLVSMNFVFGLFAELQDAIINNNVVEKLVTGANGESLETEGYEKYVGTGKFFSYNMLFSFVTGMDEKVTKPIFDGSASLENFIDHINDTNVKYQYPIVSGAAGLLLIVMFVSFALDIGVRAFTLIILQVVAPIPIMMYVTPKGKDILEKYFKMYISTYILLFVKIFIINMALYLMMYVMTSLIKDIASTVTPDETLFPGMADAPGILRVLLLVVCMIALYQFAMKLPKMLGDLFGLDMSLGGMAKTGKTLGKLAAGAIGLGIGTIGGAAGAAIAGSGVGGAVLGGLRGGVGGAQSGYRSKNISDAIQGQSKNIKAQSEWGNKIGSQGGLFRSGVATAALSADKAAGFFRGDKRNIALNQRAAAANQKAQEKVASKIQANNKGSELYNKIRSTGQGKYLQSTGYADKSAWIKSRYDQNEFKRAEEAFSLGNSGVSVKYDTGHLDAQGNKIYDYKDDFKSIQDIRDFQMQTEMKLSQEFDGNVDSYIESNLTTDVELSESFKDYQSYVNNESASYGGKTVEDGDFGSATSAHLEEAKNISGLNDEKRSLEEEAIMIGQESNDIKNTTTGNWVKTSKANAESTAAKLGHGPEQKK